MFEKLEKKIRVDLGLNAEKGETVSRAWFDGGEDDHVSRFPCLRVSVTFDEYGALPKLEKLASRLGLSCGWRPVYGGRVYSIMTWADVESLSRLNAVSDAFHEAFWNEQHRQYVENGDSNGVLSKFDAEKAIEAGKRAVSGMEV